MTKRRITRRQTWRIKKVQEERTKRALKKESSFLKELDENQLGPEKSGLLITQFGTMADVEDEQGQRYRCQLRQHLGAIVTGDRVTWRQIDATTGVIVARAERDNVLGKPDNHGEIKPVAANIDQILIVTAPKPLLSTYLIDCYLVAAETLTITPIIVFNKIDMLTAEDEKKFREQLTLYQALNYTVLFASTYETQGLDALLLQMQNKISVLVGQSGVGKSSLINVLLPEHAIRTSELSTISEKGQHTTTASTLYHLPQGGSLIDSPGIREFGLWHMKEQQIARGFIEFKPFLGKCRFRNCQHRQQAGCALQEAVDQGIINVSRLASYFKIIASFEEY